MLTVDQMLQAYQHHLDDYRLLVGFEYELFCLGARDLSPLPYARLHEVLQEAARLTGGTLVTEPVVNKVSLPGGALLSLEPGGQLELSSAPADRFSACVDQFRRFLRLLQRLKSTFDLHFFFGGVTPVHGVDDIGLVIPSERYRLMNDYFPRVGGSGRRMMRQSASVQVTFDFKNEPLGKQLLRTACFLSPFAAAALSNSPFVDGRRTDFRSYRARIWADTDPRRTGLFPGFHAPDYGFADYLEQVLAAPMFFVRTERGLVDARGMTFDQFNRDGFEGRATTMDDFVLHNSTIFTDVRLKRTVEVRGVDGQDPAMLPTVVAFLSGLLLCSAARARTLDVLGSISAESHATLPLKLAREGIAGELPLAGGGARPVRELLLELIETAREGLLNCFPDGREAGEYLDPLRELAREGLTPADRVLDRFDDARDWLAAGRTFETDRHGRIVAI